MGAARKRKAFIRAVVNGEPVEYFDIAAQEHRWGRKMPGPKAWFKHSEKVHAASVTTALHPEIRSEVRVPCNDCRACCYHKRIELHTARDQADLPFLDAVPDDQRPGQFMLRKRPDGACIHLGPDGCTVYKHRPYACRMYDCRPVGLAGLAETYDAGHRSPAWVPQPQDEDDLLNIHALTAAAQTYIKLHPDDWQTRDAFHYACQNAHHYKNLLTKLRAAKTALKGNTKCPNPK